MPTEIRRATTREFLNIAALDREAWSRNRDAQFIPDGEHAWRLWCEHATVFVAVEATVLLAAALTFPTQTGLFCFHKLFVRKDHRGCGLGSRLMAAVLAEMDRLEVDCFLTVDPANTAAVALYEKLGFTERKLVEGYYRSTEDRFVLTRRAVPAADARQQRHNSE